jgi:hypothetical protein
MATWPVVSSIGLALPETELGEAHEGSPALLVRGHQFGRLRRTEGRDELLQVWVADPELVRTYVDEDAETFSGAPGYSKKVVMARLDRLDETLAHELLIESWRCRAPASVRKEHPDLL